MPNYKRPKAPNATVFFTLCLQDRKKSLLVEHADILKNCIDKTKSKYPFKQIAWVILPDHYHCIWKLPEDGDYSLRWRQIKRNFSYQLTTETGRVWQRRFWEHHIRDQNDLINHLNYIHINPVKHGLVTQTRDWPQSSFSAYVNKNYYPIDWGDRIGISGEFGE